MEVLAQLIHNNYRLHEAMLDIAGVVAKLSYAKKAKVGAVIVRDGRILSTGYNGTPHGVDNNCEDEHGHTFDHVIHAEENALLNLSRSHETSMGATLYCTLAPCVKCAARLKQAGIVEVFFRTNWKGDKGVNWLLNNNVKVSQL
jgi:dCMP deaminase